MGMMDNGITDEMLLCVADVIDHLCHGGSLGELDDQHRHATANFLIIRNQHMDRIEAASVRRGLEQAKRGEFVEGPDLAADAAMFLDSASYVCTSCAETHGGTWPEGHVATWHEGECQVCGCNKSVANVGDWNWPDGKARGMRD